MRVWFSCKGCGARDCPVDVPDRAEGEPIQEWMPKVQRAVGMVHRDVFPRCTSQVCDLKIPTPEGTKQVGTPPETPQ